MILSDYDLEHAIEEGRIVIRPFSKEIIRENGLDMRLDREIGRHNPDLDADFVLDPYKPDDVNIEYVVEKDLDKLVIKSREQVLLSTIEYIEVPDNMVGFVELRSTWARHGLIMPPTIIDAGFKGTVTLEVLNSSSNAIMLKPDTRFAHVIFATTLNRVKNAYAGAYLGQKGVKVPKVIK